MEEPLIEQIYIFTLQQILTACFPYLSSKLTLVFSFSSSALTCYRQKEKNLDQLLSK